MSTEEVAEDVVIVEVDWWKEAQALRVLKGMNELAPGQSMIVSDKTYYALDVEDVEAIVGRTVGNNFVVFPRFGGCEIVRKRKAR